MHMHRADTGLSWRRCVHSGTLIVCLVLFPHLAYPGFLMTYLVQVGWFLLKMVEVLYFKLVISN